MLLRVCGGIPQGHYYIIPCNPVLETGHEGRTLGRMFRAVSGNAAWARRGKGCSSRCGVTCRGEVEITLAWIWRAAAVGGVTAARRTCDESCMRVCFDASWHVRRTHHRLPTHNRLTLDTLLKSRRYSRVDLQHPCCGASTHEAWPGSCCSACHTLDTAACWPGAVDDLPGRQGWWVAVVALGGASI